MLLILIILVAVYLLSTFLLKYLNARYSLVPWTRFFET